MKTHDANLERVRGQGFSVQCRHCGGWMGAGENYRAVADLNGEPWRAYFHGDSAHDCASHAGEYPAGNGIGFRHEVRQ